MRIEYMSATGCPFGQFVVYAETKEDRLILRRFLHVNTKEWQFWRHGYGSDGHPYGPSNFNFGWIPKKSLKQ